MELKMRIISALSAICYFLFVNGADLRFEGTEGGVLSFQCAHKFAQNNPKYFCINPCETEANKLAVVQPGGMTQSGKITLRDTKNGAFNITLSNLSTSDSGTYWCGVDRFGKDTYTRVDLKVTKVKWNIHNHSHKTTPTIINIVGRTEVTTSAAFLSSSTHTHKYETVTNSTTDIFQTDSGTNSSQGFTLYLIVGVVVMFTLCVIVLSIRKCREKMRPQVQACSRPLPFISSNPNQGNDQNNITSDNLKYRPAAVPLQGNHNQPIYENISYRQVAKNTTGATLSRNDHFPSYINPLPDPPEKDGGEMTESISNGGTLAKKPSLWFGLVNPQT